MKELLRPLVFMAAAGFLVGCGGAGTVEVSGKVVLPSDLKLVESDTLQVNFMGEDKPDKFAGGQASTSNQSFQFKGVHPGKYKVKVTVQAYQGMPETPKRQPAFDAFNKEQEAKPLTYEVTSEPKQSVVIDLEKRTVTKGS